VKKITLGLSLAAMLLMAGCATPPSADTQAAITASVQAAELGASVYEARSTTSPADAAKAQTAVTALSSAWSAYQAAITAGQTPNTAAVEAAVAAVLVAVGT
jgi:hypothetical protein